MDARLSMSSRPNAGFAGNPSNGLAGWALSIVSRIFNWWRLRDRPEHHRRVLRSRTVLRKLPIIFAAEGGPARVFGYLRKIDPLVFEEVILSASEQAGAFVLRNRRYTGDGGLDGRIWIPGTGLVAVQSKRYRSHIARSHIAALARVVEEGRFTAGMFVHCGRTSRQTLSDLAHSSDRIVLLSGIKLLDLLLNGQFVVGGSPEYGYRPGSAGHGTRPGLDSRRETGHARTDRTRAQSLHRSQLRWRRPRDARTAHPPGRTVG
jgi:restriction system protein